jgi:hypothetical protein
MEARAKLRGGPLKILQPNTLGFHLSDDSLAGLRILKGRAIWDQVLYANLKL